MTTLLANFWSAFDLLLVIFGFSLIIVVHELGHFLAARWAGVRVLAFAVGFGPAIFSYRKGLGLRRGSSEAEFRKLAATGRPGAGGGAGGGSGNRAPRGVDPGRVEGVSPTEYRLNVLPFGGYVRMLGQDDADPSAQSAEPDSYTSVPVWKRMVIISAGVVMNIVTAAALFMIVYTVGLETEPAKIGGVARGTPAALAVPENAANLGITDVGLQPGDRVLSINGKSMNTFNDVVLETAMAKKGEPLDILVDRPQVGQLRFKIKPESSKITDGLLSIGIMPPISNQIVDPSRQADAAQVKLRLEQMHFPQLTPGMTLVSLENGSTKTPVKSYADLEEAAAASGGEPIAAEFVDTNGRTTRVELDPMAEMQTAIFDVDEGAQAQVPHLLGLVPALTIESPVPDSGAAKAGVQPGDVVARVGDIRWPTAAECIQVISSRAGSTVRLVVARGGGGGDTTASLVDLGEVRVGGDGRIGIAFAQGGSPEAYLTSWPRWKPAETKTSGQKKNPELPFDAQTAGVMSGKSLPILPGSRVIGVSGAHNGGPATPVRTMTELRTALREHLTEQGGTVVLTVELPPMKSVGGEGAGLGGLERPLVERIEWTVPPADAEALFALSWQPPIGMDVFESEKFLDRASNPVAAVGKGLHETKRVMLTTYVTFARLWQGSVQVKHLRGPVGIAHTGAVFAEKGAIWLLFFMALVSINLAVINFLPIPIADGGHMVFLIYEQLTGKPPSVAVMNIAAVAGLILLGGVFLIVTIQDIARLFG